MAVGNASCCMSAYGKPFIPLPYPLAISRFEAPYLAKLNPYFRLARYKSLRTVNEFFYRICIVRDGPCRWKGQDSNLQPRRYQRNKFAVRVSYDARFTCSTS